MIARRAAVGVALVAHPGCDRVANSSAGVLKTVRGGSQRGATPSTVRWGGNICRRCFRPGAELCNAKCASTAALQTHCPARAQPQQAQHSLCLESIPALGPPRQTRMRPLVAKAGCLVWHAAW